jgi:hypothetical protein
MNNMTFSYQLDATICLCVFGASRIGDFNSSQMKIVKQQFCSSSLPFFGLEVRLVPQPATDIPSP